MHYRTHARKLLIKETAATKPLHSSFKFKVLISHKEENYKVTGIKATAVSHACAEQFSMRTSCCREMFAGQRTHKTKAEHTNSIYPTTLYKKDYSPWYCAGSQRLLEPFPTILDQRWGASWTVHQSITGPTCRPTPKGQFKVTNTNSKQYRDKNNLFALTNMMS